MSAAEKHPHIENPSDEQIAELLEGVRPQLREIYLAVHRLVRDAVPDVTFATDRVDGETGYGARQFGYDGWGMAALIAYSGWVSLAFLRGTELDDPGGLLEGGGKQIRHVKLRSMAEFERHEATIRRFLETAATLGMR